MSLVSKYQEMIILERVPNSVEYSSIELAVNDQYEKFCNAYESKFNDKLERVDSFDDKLFHLFRGNFYQWSKENETPSHWCYFYFENTKVYVSQLTK